MKYKFCCRGAEKFPIHVIFSVSSPETYVSKPATVVSKPETYVSRPEITFSTAEMQKRY